MEKVLITGATGFIGSHVVRYFCEKGIPVGCLVRRGSSLANIDGLPIKLEYGDIRDLESLIRVSKGYTYLIHTAAYARDWGAYASFYGTNVEGTLNVLKACVKNSIHHVTITSSVSVYGEENCTSRKSEDSPWNSHYPYFMDRIFPCKMNDYRDTKALAKKKAVAYAKENGLNLTLLEPVWVYGEREANTGFFEYIKTAKSGMPFLPGTKKNKFHIVYAKDLARAYYLAYQKRLEGIYDMIIGNEETASMDQIYSLFCQNAGIQKPGNLPKMLVYPVAFAMELFYKVLDTKKPPLLTRGRVNMFYDNIEYSTEKAKRLIGFTNEYSLEEGIEKTVDWYKEHGWI